MNSLATQSAHLERVSVRIGRIIIQFCRARFALEHEHGHQFTMDELLGFVRRYASVAPDSPGRILRQLRKSGRVDYAVLSRRDSLYQITSVKGA